MTNCYNENKKCSHESSRTCREFVATLIDNLYFSDANAPALSAGEFSNSCRSWIFCEVSNSRDDSILVWLRYFGQLSLSSSLNEQLVFQSDIPSRISDTAFSKGTGSEGLPFASS